VIKFEKEAQALNNLSLNLSYSERLDFVRRCHMAKETMLAFELDLANKKNFYDSIKKKAFNS
jgi:hypothetical protein